MCNAHQKVTGTENREGNQLGTLYGIGIGPGDPELITIKALKVLNSVGIIFAPKAGIKTSSFAADIVKGIIENKDKLEAQKYMLMDDEPTTTEKK